MTATTFYLFSSFRHSALVVYRTSGAPNTTHLARRLLSLFSMYHPRSPSSQVQVDDRTSFALNNGSDSTFRATLHQVSHIRDASLATYHSQPAANLAIDLATPAPIARHLRSPLCSCLSVHQTQLRPSRSAHLGDPAPISTCASCRDNSIFTTVTKPLDYRFSRFRRCPLLPPCHLATLPHSYPVRSAR
jgi:hypothetical protein